MHWWEFCRSADRALLLAWTLFWLPFRLNAQDIIFPDTPRFPLPPPPRSNERQSCYPHDSCQVRGNSRDTIPMDKRSCYCDFACAEYGDCCKDSRFYNLDSSINAVKMWRCTELRNYHGIFLKVACPSWWTDDDIRTQCETDTSDEHDPFLKLPVTSRITQLTYKNYYCAICNKDVVSPIFWLPHLECDGRLEMFNFTEDNFWNNIQYKESVESWGITAENNTFIPCSVDPQMPLNVEDMIRRCDPFVLNCSANWTDFEIMKQCSSYTTYVYVGERAYRNWECAKCNYVPSTDVICTKLTTRLAFPKFNSNIFTVLFDVNSQNGQQVGRVKKCDDSEVYDPFTRLCRSVICGRPGQVYRSGRCIAEPNNTPTESAQTESTTHTTTTQSPVTENTTTEKIIVPSWHFTNTTSPSDVFIFRWDGDTFSKTSSNFTEKMDLPSEETSSAKSEIAEKSDNAFETTENLELKTVVHEEESLFKTNESNQNSLTHSNNSTSPFTGKDIKASTSSNLFPPDIMNNSLHDLNTDVLQTKLTYEPFTTEEENNPTPQINNITDFPIFTNTYKIENVSFPVVEHSVTPSMVNQSDHLECEQFELNRTDYRMLENGSVYLHSHKRILTRNEFRFTNDQLFVCINSLLGSEYSNYEEKFSGYLAMVALVGLTISVLCLILHLGAFCLVSELRNLSGNNLASLCVALVVAYTMFIVAQFNPVPSTFCRVIAIIMCYAFLASFFWMNTMAFDVWRALKQATTELRISAGVQWPKFLIYSAYSWLSPLIIISISLVVEKIPSVPEDLRPSFGTKICWFNHRRALLLFFVVPIITIIIINVILFSFSAYMIISTTRNTAKMHTTKSQRTFRLYLRLALLMGLTWIIGIIAAAADVEPLWYVFVAFNTLQGLFIFFAFTFTKKVIQSILSKVMKQPRLIRKASTFADSSSDPRLTKKSGLEARDSADSQSSHTSRSTLTQTTSVNTSVDALY